MPVKITDLISWNFITEPGTGLLEMAVVPPSGPAFSRSVSLDDMPGFSMGPQQSIEFTDTSSSIILVASDSSRWQLVVDTAGNLSTVSV
jgi:hypothetical protein